MDAAAQAIGVDAERVAQALEREGCFAVAALDPGELTATAALAGAAAFGLTFVVMRFCCRTDELMHLGVFHVLPVLIGTALSAGLGVLLLPRWRSSSLA